MLDSLASPIVGAQFHRYAKAIIKMLPVDWPLVLQREPSNPAHANAVLVMVNLESASAPMWAELEKHLKPEEVAEIKAQPRRALGYLQYSHAEYIAPALDSGYKAVYTRLTFSSAGKPKVEFNIEPRKEGV